jgi:hypothetical protein
MASASNRGSAIPLLARLMLYPSCFARFKKGNFEVDAEETAIKWWAAYLSGI